MKSWWQILPKQKLKNWQNGTFEPVHEIQNIRWFKIVCIRTLPKYIPNMILAEKNLGNSHQTSCVCSSHWEFLSWFQPWLSCTPTGVPGVSKNPQKYFTNKSDVLWPYNPTKSEKKNQKMTKKWRLFLFTLWLGLNRALILISLMLITHLIKKQLSFYPEITRFRNYDFFSNLSTSRVWPKQAKRWKWVMFKTLLCQPKWIQVNVWYTIGKYTCSAII